VEKEEQREKIRIGAYMMRYTGLCELAEIAKWLDEKVKGDKVDDRNGKVHTEAELDLR